MPLWLLEWWPVIASMGGVVAAIATGTFLLWRQTDRETSALSAGQQLLAAGQQQIVAEMAKGATDIRAAFEAMHRDMAELRSWHLDHERRLGTVEGALKWRPPT